MVRRPKAQAALAPLRRSQSPAALTGPIEEQLTTFPGIDLTQGKAALGLDQNVEPPDTQIAAGPDSVVEMVNDSLTVWSKSGTRQLIADLNVFYGVPSGFSVTDPRLLYDTLSGRFIATAFALDMNLDSRVYLAVSATSNPNGNWSRWTITSTTLSQGVHTLKVKQTDIAGNTSAASAGLNVTIDTTVLAPSAPDLAAASDSAARGVRRPTPSTPDQRYP